MKEPKVKKVEELKLHIEELEERIAPGILANVAALPPGTDSGANAGTDTALKGSPAMGTFEPLWFGRAAGRC